MGMRAFNRFKHNNRTKTDMATAGLGLAICYEIIHAQHGRIWAANNATGGASLFIAIPDDTDSWKKVLS